MAKIERFEDIEAWQKARELTNAVYVISNAGKFARDFGLRDQIRRAALLSGGSPATPAEMKKTVRGISGRAHQG